MSHLCPRYAAHQGMILNTPDVSIGHNREHSPARIASPQHLPWVARSYLALGKAPRGALQSQRWPRTFTGVTATISARVMKVLLASCSAPALHGQTFGSQSLAHMDCFQCSPSCACVRISSTHCCRRGHRCQRFCLNSRARFVVRCGGMEGRVDPLSSMVYAR
jgi:hypothetical protein